MPLHYPVPVAELMAYDRRRGPPEVVPRWHVWTALFPRGPLSLRIAIRNDCRCVSTWRRRRGKVDVVAFAGPLKVKDADSTYLSHNVYPWADDIASEFGGGDLMDEVSSAAAQLLVYT